MATPLTSGAVTALRQHLRRAYGIANPTAALLKAVLIAGADRLPGTAPTGTVVDPHQGFGRIDLAAVATPAAGVSFYLGQTQRIDTGQSRRRTVSVTSSAAPLRIVLAYSDYPGTSLVNNLNLIVSAPDGTAWVGNQPPGGAALDTTNNVEVAHVAVPAIGQWTVDVIGSNVPRGPQRYALVVKGALA
jgi:serine protease AprX